MVQALEQPMYPGPHLAQRADRISCGTVSRVNHSLACPLRVLPLLDDDGTGEVADIVAIRKQGSELRVM